MRVRDVMSRGVEVVRPDATLTEAARMMRGLNVGLLPVCTGNRVVGTVTDRDIAVRGVAMGYPPDTTPVSEVMSPGVVWCFEDDEVGEVVRLMQEEQIRRVPVMSADRKLVGIVTLGDLSARLADARLVADTLSEISEPAREVSVSVAMFVSSSTERSR